MEETRCVNRMSTKSWLSGRDVLTAGTAGKNRRARATDDALMMTCSSPGKFVGNFYDGVDPSLPSSACMCKRNLPLLPTCWSLIKMALVNIGVEQLVGAEAKMMVWYRTACRSGEMLPCYCMHADD
jgi:hypothetical protein